MRHRFCIVAFVALTSSSWLPASAGEASRGSCHASGAPRYAPISCAAGSGGLVGRLTTLLCPTAHDCEVPPGNMAPRYPYDTARLYYYDRPYNAGQAEQSLGLTTEAGVDRALPYSTKVFDEIAQRAEVEAWDDLAPGTFYKDGDADRFSALTKDRHLEYVDWTKHRDARLAWERSTQPAEEELPVAKKAPVSGASPRQNGQIADETSRSSRRSQPTQNRGSQSGPEKQEND